MFDEICFHAWVVQLLFDDTIYKKLISEVCLCSAATPNFDRSLNGREREDENRKVSSRKYFEEKGNEKRHLWHQLL